MFGQFWHDFLSHDTDLQKKFAWIVNENTIDLSVKRTMALRPHWVLPARFVPARFVPLSGSVRLRRLRAWAYTRVVIRIFIAAQKSGDWRCGDFVDAG